MSKLTDNIKEKIMPDVLENGLQLEYVELIKEGAENILRIVVDKPDDKISVEDCEKLSRQVEDKVDEMVKVENGYILEVSSAGLEREIKNIELFNKYKGSKIKVKLYNKVEGLKEFEGILDSVSDSNINVVVEGKNIEIEMKNIAAAKTVYDFN